MKSKFLKRLSIVLIGAVLASSLCGCTSSKAGIGTQTNDGNKVLFTYDGEDVTLKEGWLYAKMTAAQLENTYKQYYGDSFWKMNMGENSNGEEITFEEYTKQDVITQIKQTIVLNKKAKDYNCKLTAAEKKQSIEAALSYYQSNDGREIMRECGATREDIEKIYQDATIASKVQNKIKKNAKVNVSEDEARKTTIYRIVFSTTKTNAKGNVVNMNKKEKAVIKKKAERVLKDIKSGKKTLKEAAKERNYTNTKESYSSGQSEEGTKFEKEIKKLKDGQLTSNLLDCENGYVIAKLVAYTDKKETAANKKTLKEEKQKASFEKQYNSWTKKLEKNWSYKKDVNQKLWAQVSLSNNTAEATTAVKSNITEIKK